MSLPPGTAVGAYEITGLLGEGGMGQVYRARDARLKRDVALKILPGTFAEDPARLTRFQREAEVLALLNHPNIAHIYGVEANALVMELVEGETIADRLARGPMPLDDALVVAAQIADALETAHDQGIIHRDLKPANIRLRPDGTVKVLDFGLAKLNDPNGLQAPNALSLSPTITSPAMMTGAGMLLGTAAYMSPEQAKGKAVDKRADIWAFGVILYEMLTGRGLFAAETLPETFAHVMTREVDLATLPAATPSHIRTLVARCLVKDPKQRLRDIGDARLILADRADPRPVSLPPRPGRSSAWPLLAAACVGLLAVAGAVWWSWPPAAPAPQPVALSIVPGPSGIAPAWAVIAGIRLAPDGSAIVYTDASGQYQIRRFDSLTPQPAGVGGGTSAFWSPDSQFVVLDTTADLRKKRVPDGTTDVMVKTGGPVEGATWSASGQILYTLVRTATTLFHVPAAGGTATELTLPGVGDGSYFWPEFIPGRDDFLIGFEPRDEAGMDVYLATLKDRQVVNPVRLMRNETAAAYTPAAGGRVLFVRNDTLYTQHLDLTARTLTGAPEVLAAGVATVPGFRLPEFSVSGTTIAWRPGGMALSQLTVFDRSGTVIGAAGPPAAFLSVKLSPDEQRLLLASQTDQWLVEPGQSGRLAVSQNRGALTTLWSPDSARFLVPRPSQLMQAAVDLAIQGGASPQALASVPGLDRLEDVSPDGRTVLFTHGALATALYAARLEGTADERTPKPVIQTGEFVFNARFSHDGAWIVYEAHPQIGQQGEGLYVQPFPGPGLRRQIAPQGKFPVWRKDGREIVFYDTDRLWSIRVEGTGSDLRFSNPTALFQVRPPPSVIDVTPLAVSRDGSRIYVAQPVERPNSDVIHVRLNALPQGR